MSEKTICILKRACWTFCESMLGFYTAGMGITEIDWKLALSVSATASIFSIFKSCIAGIPEANNEQDE